MTDTLRKDQYTFFIISRLILLGIKNVSDKSCRENQNTHFMFRNFFFENFVVREIMWKIYVTDGQATDDSLTQQMGFAYWISKAKGTHSEYIILIPFPRQQW